MHLHAPAGCDHFVRFAWLGVPQPARHLVACMLLAAAVLPAQGQYAAVTGRVVTAEASEPLPGAHVVLTGEAGRSHGTATDQEGTFRIGRLLPGRYTIQVSLIGFSRARDTLTLAFGERQHRVVALEEKTTALGPVTVEDERRAEGREGAGVVHIPPEILARVPAAGPSGDLAGYLTTLPGVVTRGDRGGQIFVRGGTPTQNLVLVDGMPVYQPFHLIGAYSSFPADIVSYVDVYAGGFGARYGGRIASVIDISTRTGNKQALEGSASVAPFLSAVRLNVPLVPGSVSLMGSVRESVIERVSPVLLGDSLPYEFGDQFARLHAFLNPVSSLSLTALHSYDDASFGGVAADARRVERDNLAVGGHYSYLPSQHAVRFEARAYYSAFHNDYEAGAGREYFSRVRGFGGEMAFTYLLDPVDIHFGIFGRTNKFQYDIGGRRQDVFTTEAGLFVETRVDPGGGVHIEPGVRMHSYASSGETTFAPRLRIRWRLGGTHRLTAAAGLYHQQVIGLYNLRDVTDMFIVWRPSARFEQVPRAWHLLAGWRAQLLPWLEAEVEAYAKRLRNLTFAAYSGRTGSAFQTERSSGRARGIDLRLQAARGPFYATLGYGLAEVLYQQEVTPPPEIGDILVAPDVPRDGTFHPPHDRRHRLELLAGYEHARYRVNLRWHYGSGTPFTKARGFYTAVPPADPTDGFRTDPGAVVLDLAEPYAARMPAYHRLDISAAREFVFGVWEVLLQASLINVYNRANIFDYDLITGRRTDQLPFIPSLGLEVSF